jgi:hypothetical protein
MKQKIITKRGEKTVNLSPRRAIRRNCQMCSDYLWEEVESCQTVECELHAFRSGSGSKKNLNPQERIDAILRYCRDRCCGGDEKRYLSCDMETCPLFVYRQRNIQNQKTDDTE